MINSTLISLSARERWLILYALSTIRDSDRRDRPEIDALSTKLTRVEPYPSIGVEALGG
jgi:hypothetical protein